MPPRVLDSMFGACLVLVGGLLLSGCAITDKLFGPSLPEPGTPTWEQPGASTEMRPAADKGPGRNWNDEELRRRGIIPRNPDYGFIKPGRSAGVTAHTRTDPTRPVSSGEWSEPMPSGGWGDSAADRRFVVAPVASEEVAMEIAVAEPMSSPQASTSYVPAAAPEPAPMGASSGRFEPRGHSTVGSSGAMSSSQASAPPAPARAAPPTYAQPTYTPPTYTPPVYTQPTYTAPTPSGPPSRPQPGYDPPPPPR